MAISLSVFGFQLIGAFSDSVGMEAPLPLSLALRFGVGMIFVLLVLQLRLGIRKGAAGTMILLGFGFLLLYGVNLLLKSIYNEFPLRLPWFEYTGYFFLFVFIPFFASAFAFSKENFVYLFHVLLTITAIIVLIYLSVFDVDLIHGMRYVPFASVNSIGIGYAGLTAATLSAWIVFVKKSSSVLRFLMIFAMIGGLFLAFLSGQRQVFLSLVVTVFVFVKLLRGKSRYQTIVKRIVFVGFIFSFAIVLLRNEVLLNTIDRISMTYEMIEMGSEVRAMMWEEAGHVFLNSPIIGGPIELPLSRYYPHNFVLEAFMVTGIIGGLLFLMFFLTILFLSFRLLQFNEFGWIGLFHYQVAISALLSGALYSGNLYWTSAGLVISAFIVATSKSQKIYQY